MRRFAIYTACFGGYDNLLQPIVVDDRFDYYLFTDDAVENHLGVWQVRRVDYANPDKTRIARYVKTHPEGLLPDYEATLWIDSNIQIQSEAIYERFVELLDQGVQFATIKHPVRDCAYDEAYKVLEIGVDKERLVLEWCHKMRKEKYPMHNGLYETGVLFRVNDEQVKALDACWWEQIERYSRRDQLSVGYVLWKNPISIAYYLPPDENTRNSTDIKRMEHSEVEHQKGRRKMVLSKGETNRMKCRVKMPWKKERHKKFHYWLYQFPVWMEYVFLVLWELVVGLEFGFRKLFGYAKHG